MIERRKFGGLLTSTQRRGSGSRITCAPHGSRLAVAEGQPFGQLAFNLPSLNDLSDCVARVLLGDISYDNHSAATAHEAEIAVPLGYLLAKAHRKLKADEHEAIGTACAALPFIRYGYPFRSVGWGMDAKHQGAVRGKRSVSQEIFAERIEIQTIFHFSVFADNPLMCSNFEENINTFKRFFESQ